MFKPSLRLNRGLLSKSIIRSTTTNLMLPSSSASSSASSSSSTSSSSSNGHSNGFSTSTSPSIQSTKSTHFSTPREANYRSVTKATISPAVLEAQYAVRGAIPLRSEELRDELESGKKGLPFDKVINCNIGNPQQLDQKPLTFLRQIAALTEYPELIDHPSSIAIFPADAIARARSIVKDIGSTGAYSHSMGVPAIRKRVAKFISDRDGYPASASNIYLTAGASAGVSNLFQVILHSPLDGVLIPIPQYPLYTAALALNSARAVPYYLQESRDWGLDMKGLKEELEKARSDGTVVKAMVVINPGNPTGNCLSEEEQIAIVKLCWEERLVLFADEVYQDNIYHPSKPFISFKRIISDMGAPYDTNQELVSFHSISKGQTGECGRRGGYFELVNFSEEAEEQVYKLASIQLCPSLGGQIGVDVLCTPPRKGDESYPLWEQERTTISRSLQERSEVLHEAFNKLEGMTCNEAEGALYLFPTITLSPSAIAAAKEANQSPDAFYCLRLLEESGICVVPGSGFGQVEGSWHFRTTFLAPEVEEYVERFTRFHEGFMSDFK